MDFKILHLSSARARVRANFRLTPDVKVYFKEQASKIENIQKVDFYQDEYTFVVMFKDGCNSCLQEFFKLVDKEKVRDCYENPVVVAEESPYSIIVDAMFWRVMSKLFVPLPLRAIHTWWKASGYLKDTLKLLGRKQITMETLDSAAILVSLATGARETASSIMFILELGEALNNWSEKKSVKVLEQSLTSMDREIWLVEEEGNRKVTCAEVKKGDIILVSEGNEILFDGIVMNGGASVDESSLTGESFPVVKNIGDEVYSNTIVVNGEIKLRVENPQVNGRIQHLIQLMKDSENREDTYHYKYIKLADSIVKYNFLAMGLTYLFTRSFAKAMSFLLVDYSCALKLSTPVAYLTTIKNLIDQFYEYSYEEVLRIGACLEEHIYHPIASAVVSKAEEDGIEHEEMHTELYHIASKGIVSHIDGEKVVIGSRQLLKDEGVVVTAEQEQIIAEKQEQYNLLFLGYKEKLISIFCVDIPLRGEASAVLTELRNRGKKVVLLTGDNEIRTKKILKDVTFDEVHTSMTPVTKFEYIKSEKEQGESDVSIVMSESADLSKQISDVVLKSDSLNSLLLLSDVSKTLRAQMSNNVKSTVSINSSLIFLGLINVLPSNLLALLHNLTTFSIVLKNFNIK